MLLNSFARYYVARLIISCIFVFQSVSVHSQPITLDPLSKLMVLMNNGSTTEEIEIALKLYQVEAVLSAPKIISENCAEEFPCGIIASAYFAQIEERYMLPPNTSIPENSSSPEYASILGDELDSDNFLVKIMNHEELNSWLSDSLTNGDHAIVSFNVEALGEDGVVEVLGEDGVFDAHAVNVVNLNNQLYVYENASGERGFLQIPLDEYLVNGGPLYKPINDSVDVTMTLRSNIEYQIPPDHTLVLNGEKYIELDTGKVRDLDGNFLFRDNSIKLTDEEIQSNKLSNRKIKEIKEKIDSKSQTDSCG